MAKKYIKCIKCDIDTPLNYAKYCNECRLQISLNSLQRAGYKPKDRLCRKCSETFFAIGPSSIHCSICAPKVHKQKSKLTNDNYRRRKGIDVGIGSGNNQKGSDNHAYINGIKNYSSRAREAKGNTCERCNILLNFTTRKWGVHHKDRDRTNNKLENLELLCSRCHNLEHNCISHLPNR